MASPVLTTSDRLGKLVPCLTILWQPTQTFPVSQALIAAAVVLRRMPTLSGNDNGWTLLAVNTVPGCCNGCRTLNSRGARRPPRDITRLASYIQSSSVVKRSLPPQHSVHTMCGQCELCSSIDVTVFESPHWKPHPGLSVKPPQSVCLISEA